MGVRRKSFSQTLFCLVLLLSALLLVGCQPGFQTSAPAWPMAEVGRDGDNNARISVFLNLKEADGPAVRLEVSSLEVLTDGIWLPLGVGPVKLDSEKIGETQVFLGGRALPPGNYHRLRIAVIESSVRRDDGRYEPVPLDPPLIEMEFPSLLALAQDDSRSLFITWDVESSLERADELRPVMTIAPDLRQLLVDLVYVACPDVNTIFVVRSDKNWVADSFGIKGQPTYLAMDPDPSRKWLYVLASRESAIKIVDLSSQRVVDSIHIPLTDAPSFMTISADAQWAYVLEERSSYLNQIDLGTGRSSARVRIEYRPQFAAYLAERDLLAISTELTQTISFHSPSDLRVVGTIRTGSSPQGLLLSNRQLYITESGDHTVSIYDFAGNRIQNRLDVGINPRRLFSNGDQLYVSNYGSGTLSVLVPGQMGAVREIRGLGRPLEMAFNQAYRRLYVGDEKAGGLAVVDTTANQLLGWIQLGARPLGLAVLE